MGDFVNGEEEVLVGGGTDYIGCEEEWDGKYWSVSQTCRTGYLKKDNSEDEISG